MTFRTTPRAAFALTMTLLLTCGGIVGQAAAAPPSIRSWANGVWDAARRGDALTLERKLEAIPVESVDREPADRFLRSLEQLRANRAQAETQREEARLEALDAMRTELEEEDRAEALRQAVIAQTFSDDLDSAFHDEEIMGLIRWAEQRVPEVETERSWLDAQVLLYRLRTFYDDTTRRADFHRYDKHLDRVNQRVGLIARYTPARLHEMRNEQVVRMGEEPLGEFNPATAIDWQERLDDIDAGMLKAALRAAAAEHIESLHWRPLLQGGLENLKLLATTTVLAETFPSLADAALVSRWCEHIDGELMRVAETPDDDLDTWTCQKILDALVAVNEDTVRLPVQVILREFGDGGMTRLDAYSEIIWPDKLRRFQQATAGNFVGVGILIRHNDKREIMVVNPLEGTPAATAGVKPNDLIVEVDGDTTVGWSLNDAVDRITGPKETVVTLGLRREGQEELIEVPIVRDVIKIRSVKGWNKQTLDANGEPVWDWYIDPLSRIVYIRLTQFTEDSHDDLVAAWREMSEQGNPAGLVLDLRHNPGGLLTAAVRISNLFVPEGRIVSGEDKDGKRVWLQRAHRRRAMFAGVPTVVLINKGSASASEIVAGCLQAHGAAIIVGEQSFGKGSVQTVHHIAPNARLKLTTQYYRLPSPDGGVTPGQLVHKRPGAEMWGVRPDIEAPMAADQVVEAINLWQSAEIIPLDENGNPDPDHPDRPDVNDLLTKGIDSQLETALLILRAKTLGSEAARHADRRGS